MIMEETKRNQNKNEHVWLTSVIEDGRQHVQVKDSPKLNGVWFSLQVYSLKGISMAIIFVTMADK